jgi:hypothetical protein
MYTVLSLNPSTTTWSRYLYLQSTYYHHYQPIQVYFSQMKGKNLVRTMEQLIIVADMDNDKIISWSLWSLCLHIIVKIDAFDFRLVVGCRQWSFLTITAASTIWSTILWLLKSFFGLSNKTMVNQESYWAWYLIFICFAFQKSHGQSCSIEQLRIVGE